MTDKRRTGFANGIRRESENRDLINEVLRLKRKMAETQETVRAG